MFSSGTSTDASWLQQLKHSASFNLCSNAVKLILLFLVSQIRKLSLRISVIYSRSVWSQSQCWYCAILVTWKIAYFSCVPRPLWVTRNKHLLSPSKWEKCENSRLVHHNLTPGISIPGVQMETPVLPSPTVTRELSFALGKELWWQAVKYFMESVLSSKLLHNSCFHDKLLRVIFGSATTSSLDSLQLSVRF